MMYMVELYLRTTIKYHVVFQRTQKIPIINTGVIVKT